MSLGVLPAWGLVSAGSTTALKCDVKAPKNSTLMCDWRVLRNVAVAANK